MFSISFDVERTVTIHRDSADVFESVADFSTWDNWSPWLCQESNCPVTIEGNPGTEGHSQEWAGEFIGSGRMHITKVVSKEALEYEIMFFKPRQSSSTVGFRFTPLGEDTEVAWWMRGRLPVFMFPLKKQLLALIGGDYSRALSMLKEYLETGKVLSETTVKGLVNRGAMYYLGRRRSCNLSEVGPAMEEDFSELEGLLKSSAVAKPKEVFSIYHSYDMVKGLCEYTSGFLYDSPQEASEGCVIGQLQAHRALAGGSPRALSSSW